MTVLELAVRNTPRMDGYGKSSYVYWQVPHTTTHSFRNVYFLEQFWQILPVLRDLNY